MKYRGLNITFKSKNQSSDLMIFTDEEHPQILYDSNKTNNDMDKLECLGISIIETDNITKLELI